MNIIINSDKDDWLHNETPVTNFVYKKDLNIYIIENSIDHNNDKFIGEDWAVKHPDPNAYKVFYDIYYGSTFVMRKMLVSVDGHRATLPLPYLNSNIVKKEDYQFAKIVDTLNSLDEYMKRANLKIEESIN